MQITNRVINLAKERALFAFSMLAEHMLAGAEDSITQSISLVRSAADQRQLSNAHRFLQQEGNLFLQRFDTFFRDCLERAMQTMYTDLRLGLHNMSAEALSLIDDDTINRQIEVDRLVLRIRDADHEHLGRINMIIAQLHGDHDVRERENPFRPYLLARSLHEVLHDMVKDGALAAVLFDRFSAAMIKEMPAYYAAIREIFEWSGVRAKILARPSMLTKAQRNLLAQQAATGLNALPLTGGLTSAPEPLPRNFDSHILPSLQRMLKTLQDSDSSFGAGTANLDRSAVFQDFVWQIFNQPHPVGLLNNRKLQGDAGANELEEGAQTPVPASPLPVQLKRYQQLAAAGRAIGEAVSPGQNQLFALREKIDARQATELERIAMEVVALLFEFILQDEQIPAGLREQIGRLQIPFLRAAILAPELLHQAAHPARQLLNRMGAVAVGVGTATPVDQAITDEIARIATMVLDKFDDDMTIFRECLEELEQFLVARLPAANAQTVLCAQAMDETEREGILLLNTAKALQGLLAPLSVDTRVFDFIMQVWTRVLIQPLRMEQPVSPDDAAIHRQCLDLLPELVWSAQEKRTLQERSALIRLLPDLVKRLKKGLDMVRLPEQESKRAMDQLVAVHTQVLRSPQTGAAENLPDLDELRRHFSLLTVDQGSAVWIENQSVRIQATDIDAALTRHGVTARLAAASDAIPMFSSDAEWLNHMKLGVHVEFWSGDTCQLARLMWVTACRSLYLFQPDRDSVPLVYSSASLLKMLREDSVHLVEYAPLFERAMESILVGAESLRVP